MGKILFRTKPIEFLEFLGQIASELPEGVEANVIMDNYHMTEEFEEFFDLYPQVSFYATPPRASWLNLVEIFT